MNNKPVILVIAFAFVFLSGAIIYSKTDPAETKGQNLENPSEKSVDRLVVELKDHDPKVRMKAAGQLGSSGNTDAVAPLIFVLKYDDVWNVRKSAAWALGELKDRRSVGSLIEALRHNDWIVQFKAAEALGKIGDTHAVEPLIETLQSESSHVYEQVTWALGELCDDRAVIPLINALENELPAVRMNSAKALGKIRNNSAVGPLIAALMKDRIPEVKKWAAWALGVLDDSRAIEPLIVTLDDGDYYVRMHAGLSLEKIGKPAVPFLIRALNDKSAFVHTRAAWALQEITGADYGKNTESWEKWLLENGPE